MDLANTENLLNYCLKKKKSLTPSRTLVIKTLSNHKKPISAYELRDEINNNGDINYLFKSMLKFFFGYRLVIKSFIKIILN